MFDLCSWTGTPSVVVDEVFSRLLANKEGPEVSPDDSVELAKLNTGAGFDASAVVEAFGVEGCTVANRGGLCAVCVV